MMRKNLSGVRLGLYVLTIAVIVFSVSSVFAQGERSIVPYPRDITVETIDPVTKTSQTSFCIGVNTIDVKLTNNSGYRKYISVINRDTRGMERTLYRGWLESGTHYLSTLMRAQLELTGPAGTEAVWVQVHDYGQGAPGAQVSFYVRDCGGPSPGPGPWPGYAQLWAGIYPYAIEQGKKGTITLRTNVGSQSNMMYYFEILNSWGQLWKRLPVSKQPYELYQISLPVGKTTKPGILTYTVKLWLESWSVGEPQTVATAQFSFRVVTPGTSPAPYEPGYPWPPGQYGGSPYSGMPSYTPASPYTMPPYSTYPYGGASGGYYGYYTNPQSERQID